MIIKTPTHCAAYTRAIQWAEANPDKIQQGLLATDADGIDVGTMSDKATCFCVLGRVARELGVDTISTARAMEIISGSTMDQDADDLWNANDYGVASGKPLAGFKKLKELMA